jgi:hypothetical protein
MEIEALLSAIGSFGFPIVAYLLIYFDLRKIIEKQTASLEKVLLRFENLAKKITC